MSEGVRVWADRGGVFERVVSKRREVALGRRREAFATCGADILALYGRPLSEFRRLGPLLDELMADPARRKELERRHARTAARFAIECAEVSTLVAA